MSNGLGIIVKSLENMSPKQIASALEKWGIQGRPKTTQRCPLARWMHELYGGRFTVGQKKIVRELEGRSEEVATPENMATFVHDFDLCKFPKLIAPPPRALPKTAKKRGPNKVKARPAARRPSKEVGR